jgi:hypothetical protein
MLSLLLLPLELTVRRGLDSCLWGIHPILRRPKTSPTTKPGESVTNEMPLPAPPLTRRLTLRAELVARQSVWMLLTGHTNGLMVLQ